MRSQITKDIVRTFPSNPLFGTGDKQGPLLLPLKRILLAYCARTPSHGYCQVFMIRAHASEPVRPYILQQGLNFIAATLLMVLPEVDAFWVRCRASDRRYTTRCRVLAALQYSLYTARLLTSRFRHRSSGGTPACSRSNKMRKTPNAGSPRRTDAFSRTGVVRSA